MKKLYFILRILFLLLFTTGFAIAQEYEVSGKVTDARTAETMAGVSVIVKGTNQGTVTDINGDFALKVQSDPAVLQFSFIGYLTKEVQVSPTSSKVDVLLDEDITNLEEVVITGLASSVKRSNLANSVASVSAAELYPDIQSANC